MAKKITSQDIGKAILARPLSKNPSETELMMRESAAMLGRRGPVNPMDAQDIQLASKMHSSLMEHGHGHWHMHDRGAGSPESATGHTTSVHAFNGQFELNVKDWDHNTIHRSILPTTDPMRVGHEVNVALAHPELHRKVRETAVDRDAKMREYGL